MKSISIVRSLFILSCFLLINTSYAQQPTPAIIKFAPGGTSLNVFFPSYDPIWDDEESFIEDTLRYSIERYASFGETATYTPWPSPGSYFLDLISKDYPEGRRFYAAISPPQAVHICPVGFNYSFNNDQCLGPPCAEGKVYDSTLGCVPQAPKKCKPNAKGTCQEPNKKPPKDCENEATKHPIHFGTGNKFLTDEDFQTNSSSALKFVRHYNSLSDGVVGSMGIGWRHNFDRSISRDMVFGNQAMVMTREDGSAYRFEFNGSGYVRSSGFVNDVLTELKDSNGTTYGWKYFVAEDNSTELYNAYGQLISIEQLKGTTIRLQYTSTTTEPGKLILITSNFGEQIRLNYDDFGRVSSARFAGGYYRYSYDGNNNLIKVEYPDTKTKQYLYNEAAYTSGVSLPNALTGIIDENNERFATYLYDAEGRAISEYLGAGVNQYSILFGANGISTVTDPLGTANTVQFTPYFDRLKNTGETQASGAGCGPAVKTKIRDLNGNVIGSTNFNGVSSNYSYDSVRNVETSRIEAAGTGQARKISTVWHPTFRLPTQIDEPLKRTTYTYDVKGNVLTRTEQATNDYDGTLGASASVVGPQRTWTFTYNGVGQVLSATGPRTDVVEQTNFIYSDANLYSVTNAAGHTTTFSNFNRRGQPGVITDPNGVTTQLSYHPRGWLLSRSVTADGITETTTYTYDGVGQLKMVNFPDNSQILYTYDSAHRLTQVNDSLGNSIVYTLDNMGNRIKEEVKDSTGALSRQVSRVYDALNRLKEVTGGLQ